MKIAKIIDYDPALVAIHQAAFERSWTEDDFKSYLLRPFHSFFGLWLDDHLRAFVLFAQIADEAEILTLATSKSFCNKGLAQHLLQQAFQTFGDLGLKTVLLEVAVDNAPALRLYEKLGFEKQGVRKAYYARNNGPAVDAVMMGLTIAKKADNP